MKKFTIATVFILVVGLVAFSAGPRAVSAQSSGCTIDMTSVNDLLTKAKTAYASGDFASGAADVADARAALGSLQSQCASGNVAAMCNYIFDATIRKGPDAGLDLNGDLLLIQTSAKAVIGFVLAKPAAAAAFNLGGDALAKPNLQAKPQAVMVDGDLNGKAITLRFTLPNNAGTVTGTGTMESSIADCAGTMQGTAQGPSKDSTGDWLSGSALSGCISKGASDCIARLGANGSIGCAVEKAAICQASPDK